MFERTTKERYDRPRPLVLRRIPTNETSRHDLQRANLRLLSKNLSLQETINKLQKHVESTNKKYEEIKLKHNLLQQRVRSEEKKKLELCRENVALLEEVKKLRDEVGQEATKNAKLDEQVQLALEMVKVAKQSRLRKMWRSARSKVQ